MRKFYPPIIAILILVIFTAAYGPDRLTNSLLLYVRIARLSTQDPPARIAMPVQDVQKKQIIDTWHAPRGSDRLHEGQDIFAPRGTPVYSATKGYIYNIGENNL